MVRRLTKPAASLLTMACIVFAVPPSDLLEAVTSMTLGSLLGGGTLSEGDKTFSNFHLDASTAPNLGSLVVASQVPGGIELSVPLNLSASFSTGGEPSSSFASLSFDVTAAAPNLISTITVGAGGSGNAEVGTNFFVGGANVGAVFVDPPSAGTPFDIPDSASVGLAVEAGVLANHAGDSGEIDDVVFTVGQNTPPSSSVPEPNSLVLIVSGAAMLGARCLSRRRS